MVKGTAPGADRKSILQCEARRRPGANPWILTPAAEAEVRRAAQAALHQSDPRRVADSTIPRSDAPGHASPYSSARHVVSQGRRTKGPGRECESLGRLGDTGKYPRIVSYLAADGMMGGIYRVDITILTCSVCRVRIPFVSWLAGERLVRELHLFLWEGLLRDSLALPRALHCPLLHCHCTCEWCAPA